MGNSLDAVALLWVLSLSSSLWVHLYPGIWCRSGIPGSQAGMQGHEGAGQPSQLTMVQRLISNRRNRSCFLTSAQLDQQNVSCKSSRLSDSESILVISGASPQRVECALFEKPELM